MSFNNTDQIEISVASCHGKIADEAKVDGKTSGNRAKNSSVPKKNLTPDELALDGLLGVYYTRLFPFEDTYRWLKYGQIGKFQYREFSNTLPRGDIFFRNLSFNDHREMAAHCAIKKPIKIDIGGRYNVSPGKLIPTLAVYPVERELIFDIDLSDYNDVRTCCKDADICPRCWKFAAVACKILNISLREDFGWRHILWVFSGRRGIHCWVCDPSARKLNSEQRRQILMYYKLSSQSGKRIHLGSGDLYHHARRSFDIAMTKFERMCVKEQGILASEERIDKFLSLIPSDFYRAGVEKLFEMKTTSTLRWLAFQDFWNTEKTMCSEEWKKHRHLLEEIVLYYTYPRIDFNVSIGLNHLLKAPFSPHPNTKMLCVPFDPNKVDLFDVKNVPSLYGFVKQIGNTKSSIDERVNLQKRKYEEAVELFKDFADRVDKFYSQKQDIEESAFAQDSFVLPPVQ